MKNLALIIVLASAAACSSSGGSVQPPPSGGSGHELGTFHPGPYTDPSSGKTCGGDGSLTGGGYCDDDQQCHRANTKCLKQ